MEAWINAGRFEEAGKVLSQMDCPPARLSAKYLRAQGRLLEAVETLQTALDRDQGDEHEPMLCDLIDLLEESGNVARLRRTLQRIEVDQPTALARAGLAWLWLGEFHAAAVRSARLARVEGSSCTGLVVLLVAATMLRRPTLVERALRRLRRSDEPIDRNVVADAWCRGLMGRLLQSQRNPRNAGADPQTGQLGLLLGQAERTFQQQLASDDGLTSADRRELTHYQDVCREGLQLTVQTAPTTALTGHFSSPKQAAAVAA